MKKENGGAGTKRRSQPCHAFNAFPLRPCTDSRPQLQLLHLELVQIKVSAGLTDVHWNKTYLGILMTRALLPLIQTTNHTMVWLNTLIFNNRSLFPN